MKYLILFALCFLLGCEDKVLQNEEANSSEDEIIADTTFWVYNPDVKIVEIDGVPWFNTACGFNSGCGHNYEQDITICNHDYIQGWVAEKEFNGEMLYTGCEMWHPDTIYSDSGYTYQFIKDEVVIIDH